MNDTPTEAPTSLPRGALLAVLLLCLPAILSTGVFLAGVLTEPLQDYSDWDPFRAPTWADWLGLHVGWPILFSCFLGASYRPALIPIPGLISVLATRRHALRSRV